MNKTWPDLHSQPYIHRFGDSYDEFVQVLIDKFTLTREGNGKCLEIEIGNNLNAIRDPKSRNELNKFINDEYKNIERPWLIKLGEFETDNNFLSYRFETSPFTFRYANGGVLPIMKIKDVEYFCLFYRAIFPVGWNIANGASNNIKDIRNPERIVHREFSEEFIIADHSIVSNNDQDKKEPVLYVYDTNNPETMSGTQELAIKLWKDRLQKYSLENYTRASIPVKWIEGEDSLKIKYIEENLKHDDLFVNITPDDNAIEIDKIALINLTGDFSFYDGEVAFPIGSPEGFLLDRIIGFFPVEEFINNLSSNCFNPEFIYYTGEKRDWKEFDAILKEDYFLRHRKVYFRDSDQDQLFEKAKNNGTHLDLCPITRVLAEKYMAWQDTENSLEQERRTTRRMELGDLEDPEEPDFHVFISFKTKDQDVAELLYNFLTSKGHKVFCSSKSIQLLGTSEYMKAIDMALKKSECLVVVGSDLECFESGWVDYEWRTFQMMLLSNHKIGELYTLTQNIDPGDLPLGLMTRENIRIINNAYDISFNNLYGYLKSSQNIKSIK